MNLDEAAQRSKRSCTWGKGDSQQSCGFDQHLQGESLDCRSNATRVAVAGTMLAAHYVLDLMVMICSHQLYFPQIYVGSTARGYGTTGGPTIPNFNLYRVVVYHLATFSQ